MQRKWGDFLDSAAYSTSGSREIHMHEREAAFEKSGGLGGARQDRTGQDGTVTSDRTGTVDFLLLPVNSIAAASRLSHSRSRWRKSTYLSRVRPISSELRVPFPDWSSPPHPSRTARTRRSQQRDWTLTLVSVPMRF